ncbi:oxidoreductase [Ponticoccus sp. SC2-23]|uniref:oxidoreductase n=1 Tax=Alexandriicola marinus TaxID=2081710 RepID=UPI000FD796B7|nr:oxidoreductase [Alexandriicola marinus]MBM1221943.1 oxidoreductase [Ponticoccus sp. SC6-9]MBM1226294.1 oxidoreductase [Ponticoccus sp. SC6-15]MBM1230890.1 oxidoreductase [Ponticoccus sp. SC6-38]MBM1235269.1 oxidoreductase [Ponticoccus sp. SC6-45]MBM1239912.1 oxidoreductase [Ponticoccus sp. SC6-49]MBM1244056.1 oxidoreductase [Ponticoccus sp. SC2-64]MBM1248793.1 oxidoreductase [Ponticoccus sp. SC6-42]MBM1253567.1 oxidoreductase [Ponticoccus sp. SC6-33]MBM1257920.1 oxidoreductase [Ponticoc
MFNRRELGIALTAVIVLAAGQTTAQDGTILTFATGDSVMQYTLDDLRAIDATEFETTTIWTDGPQVFTGVALDVLLAHIGAEGTVLSATAINDYAIEIPVTDAIPGGPIIAYERNGETMSVRDKGPLWIVYPYDSNSEYQSEVTYSRSIWQLDRLELLD